MLIDCDTCIVRGNACRDCVVTIILNQSARPVELDAAEQSAVGSRAASGLVPPLRLVRDSHAVGRPAGQGVTESFRLGAGAARSPG